MAQALTRNPVVVLGASSQIGWFIVPRLVASGHRVVAVSRKGRPAGYPLLRNVDWVRAEALRKVGEDAVGMISVGPIQLAESALEVLPAIGKAVVFSTTSVLSKANSPDPSERDTIALIAQAEARLSEACRHRGVGLCLLRPTLVYGCGMDANVSRLARVMRVVPWLPVAGAASGKRQPVHADDLAAAAVHALDMSGALPEALNLCGGSTLTYLEMLRRIAQASGQRLRPVQLPEALMRLGFRLLGLLPGVSDIGPAMARRQNQDLVFDDSPARTLLGYRPRAFRPCPEDFYTPDPERILALAGTVSVGGNEVKSAKM